MNFSDPISNIKQLSLGKGSIVADFGSGSGFYTMASAKAIGTEGRVFAVDVQRDLLDRLTAGAKKENLLNISAMWGDLEKTGGSKLAEKSCDLVLVCNILFQIEDKKIFIQEVSRVLKPGGRALVVDWMDSFSGLGPEQSKIIASSEAQALFEEQGFSLEKEIDSGTYQYGLVFRKN